MMLVGTGRPNVGSREVALPCAQDGWKEENHDSIMGLKISPLLN